MCETSIVILTKNAGEDFHRTLTAIFDQECDEPFEVIVVDSGSTDRTIEIAKEFGSKIFKIRPEEFNFGLTRDWGFSLSSGKYIVSISQDVIPVNTKWLRELLLPMSDANVGLVQGSAVLPTNGPVFYWDRFGLFYFTRECRRWSAANGGIGVSFVNCAIRRSVWEVNRFEAVEMSEDKVFQKKLLKTGSKIYRSHQAMCYHAHAYDLNSLAKRCENEGLGWRIVGESYSLLDMSLDIMNRKVWRALYSGIIHSKIVSVAELLFPFVRPLFVFKGNHFAKKYVR